MPRTASEFHLDDAHRRGGGRESLDERTKRLERERELLGEGRDDIRQGRIIPEEQVDAWLQGLTGDEPLAIPEEKP